MSAATPVMCGAGETTKCGKMQVARLPCGREGFAHTCLLFLGAAVGGGFLRNGVGHVVSRFQAATVLKGVVEPHPVACNAPQSRSVEMFLRYGVAGQRAAVVLALMGCCVTPSPPRAAAAKG